MIKKYFALSMVAASVALAGCSSDDNPAEEVPVDPVVVATPGIGGSAFDSIVNSDAHTTLRSAIDAAGLADVLDNPANTYTIFAPTDAAFQAMDAANGADDDATTLTTTELLDAANQAALVRLLQYHVLSGDFSSTALSESTTDAADAGFTLPTLLTDGDTAQTVAFALDAAAPFGLSVNGAVISAVDVIPADEEATQGRVHVIDSVLTAPAAPVEPEPEPEPENPGSGSETPAGGATETALRSAGNFEGFLSGFANFGLVKLDEEVVPGGASPWTILAPTDQALAGNAPDFNHLIHVNGRLTPADLLAAREFVPFNAPGVSYPVTGTVDALFIGGHAVQVIGGGESANITYSIQGNLP